MLCQNHPQFVDEDEKNVLHQWDYNKTQYTLILIISSCYTKIIKNNYPMWYKILNIQGDDILCEMLMVKDQLLRQGNCELRDIP